MSDVDQVRLIIADLDSEEDRLFTDEQLQSFLDLTGGVVRLAAADALETIAASELLVSKKIRTQDLQTDGPAVAAELRKLAQTQRDLHDQDWEGFDVVPTVGSSRRPEHTRGYLTSDEFWGL